jgi:hypothetical protein
VKQVITTFIIVLMLVSSGYAEKPRTIAVYKQHIHSDEHDQGNFDHHLHHMLYLSGVADAYTVLNNHRAAAEQPLLYCQPGEGTLNGNDYIRILEQRLYHPDTPLPDHLTVAEGLLLSLQDEFPCN